MVRAWVAFACTFSVVPRFWSTSTTGMPRRPSSLASISPNGPPPAMHTEVCVGSMQSAFSPESARGRPIGKPIPARYRRALGDRAFPPDGPSSV